MGKNGRFFFIIFFIGPLVLMSVAFIESQIFLRIYGADNIPTIPFLIAIIITCIAYRKCLAKVFDRFDRSIGHKKETHDQTVR